MNKYLGVLLTGGLVALIFNTHAEMITPEIEQDFRQRLDLIENAGKLSLHQRNLSDEQRDALKMLYAYMPLPDMTDRSVDYYLEYVVDPALRAREEMPWGDRVNDTLFRHFVLPVRVNNEALDRHRPEFYEELKERVKGLSMKEAILAVNHWCHEKATYQPSDGRTHSPQQTVSSAIGRCGEESTFTVAALRSVGIPARQVYTPRWAHTDDNHAWVEAWADGEWHFLGACEPEPVLDLGWFNAPASRGMLMHARVFGNYAGSEERLEKIDGITFINVTDNYAPVDTITIRAVYPDGTPAGDAKASFRLYNYAEFYPIAEKTTDRHGEASLVAGLGDLLLWVSDGARFGFSKGSVGKDRSVTVTLDRTAETPFEMNIDVTPPTGLNAEVAVSDTQRMANDRMLQHDDSIRGAYLSTFCSSEEARRIAEALDVDPDLLIPILRNARGNHSTITGFLQALPSGERSKGLLLLRSLTEKDLTDVPVEILDDHMLAVNRGVPNHRTATVALKLDDELFGPYVLSPRIADEELTPFRLFFLQAFPDRESRDFHMNPWKWEKWVSDHIKASETWYPEQITMSPKAVYETGFTSPESRDVFFVAGARSFGIPARIDPVTGKTQWWNEKGEWRDVSLSAEKSQETDEKGQGTLILDYEATSVVPDPKYYTHFTVSKISGGEPTLLNYPDFQPLSESFGKGERLDAGTYLLTSGQRMADGGVLARIESVDLNADAVTAPLTVRHDDTKVQVIGSFDSESLFLPEGSAKPVSLLSATGRGYYTLVLLKAGHEPSNHVLRDIAEASAQLDATGRPIVVLTQGEGFGIDLKDFPPLPSCTVLGSDPDGSILAGALEGIGLNGADLPLILVADTFNRVVFESQGYTIGIGDRLASLLRMIND
ncbi:MAG: transglutaminase domain-containing protein [Muribaculaceae bacterium]|nr:transglutaminase domain-containing protein [Muribaculaceae bacterium]